MGYEDVRKLHAWQETRIPNPTTFANQMHYWGCRTVELAEISMRDVRREERRLAEEAGEYFTDPGGTQLPATGAITDGGYPVRSTKNNVAKSDACSTIFIGERTRKVMNVTIKQKSCSICKRVQRKTGKRATPADHRHGVCYKNEEATKSVNDFEATSVANFYREAPDLPEDERMFIIRRIGDDCRSSFAEITKTVPRIAGAAQNVLCINHEMKNLFGRLTVGLDELLAKAGKPNRRGEWRACNHVPST
jgi:hypothetical protein